MGEGERAKERGGREERKVEVREAESGYTPSLQAERKEKERREKGVAQPQRCVVVVQAGRQNRT